MGEHDLMRFWRDSNQCVRMRKDAWKKTVYKAVETKEETQREARFTAMTGSSAARYLRIKKWSKVTEPFAKFTGEVDKLGALVHERYLDDHDEPTGTKIKLQCRAGNVPVLRKVGQEMKWAPTLWKCMLCNSGEIETQEHLALSCPEY